MADSESQARLQLAHGIASLGETLRGVANLADHYAATLMHGHIDPALHAQSMAMPPMHPHPHPHAPPLMPPPHHPHPGFIEPAAQAEEVMNGRKRKATVVEGEEGGKRKRKLKDPNAPKRPPSSYILYQNEIRQQIKKEHPEMTNSELLAFISKQWAEMDESEKARYNNMCAAAKEAYTRDKAKWDALSPEQKLTSEAQRKVQMAHAGSISEDADAAHDEDEGHEDDEDDDEISQSGQLGAGKPMSFNGRQKTKKMRH